MCIEEIQNLCQPTVVWHFSWFNICDGYTNISIKIEYTSLGGFFAVALYIRCCSKCIIFECLDNWKKKENAYTN